MWRSLKTKITGVLQSGTALEWGFLVGLALPMFTYHIVLRSIRVAQRGAMPEVLRWVDVYKSDLMFHAAFVLAGLALLVALRGRKLRWLAFVSLQLMAIVISSVELVAFRFFVATGSTVDFQLIWFTLSQLSETFEVVASEVPNYIWWMMGISGTLALFLPLLVTVGWSKYVTPRLQPVHGPVRRRGLIGLALAAIVALGLALAPPLSERSYAFARNAFLNVAMSAAWSVSEVVGGDASAVTSTTQARLEPRSDESGSRNVVVILLESTRASAVSVYNPELKTTPHLEELAKTSLVAERAYAVVPHTSKALVSTLCGIEPRLHMPITEAMADGIPANCLAKLLAEQGYRTGFFQSATRRFENRQGLLDNMGYGDFVPLEEMNKKGFAKVNYFGNEDDIMLAPSGKWIDEVKDKPFFLTYLTLTPHHNYLAPRRYGRHEFASDDDEVNRYLNTVHYVDAFVNNVIEMFKEKGIYEDTVFVIVGDHGEGFGEHGRRQHDNVIWEEGLHVPLIIHDPQRFQDGKRLPYLVNQLDILPTVSDMLGFDIRDATYPGRSMLRLDTHRTMRAHCWYERRCMASIYKNEKFIYHFEQRPDEFFDLGADPLEEKDLAESTEGLQQRRSDLITWRARVNALYRQHAKGRIDKFVSTEPPVVEHPIEDVQFGEFVKLVGVQYPQEAMRPGSNASVTLVFEVLEKFPPGWKLFVHGESPGTKMKNLDHTPVDGLYPLEDWSPGDFVSDNLRFRIPRKARNQYTLWVGFYHPDDGRAEVQSDMKSDGKNRVEAIVIDLENPKPKKPAAPKKK